VAIIRPFRAWRYNEDKVEDINRKFSPLFDVVSPEQLQQLYAIPNNSIHISVPRSDEEALAKLKQWKEKGIIHQDAMPAIYIYYQRFSLFGEEKEYVRKGFVAMIRVAPNSGSPDSDIVLHEDTISSSVHERTRLLRKTLLNTAPTHGLYEDPGFELEALMDSYMEEPRYEYIDYQGVINQLAIVQNREDIEQFIDMVQNQKVYLADGHHRLASSVKLQQDSVESGLPLPPDSFRNYHLMYLTNLLADDLRILPIHRVLTLAEKTYNPKPILNRLNEFFDIEDITFSRAPIFKHLPSHTYRYGMVLGNLQYLLTLKPSLDPVRDIPLDLPQAVKQLAYTVFHYFVFDRGFGLPYADQHGCDDIAYIKDYGGAVKQAARNRNKVAFIMQGTSMDQMMQVCKAGALMPQKSTYFYPKVVCGLVFASIDDHENQSPFDSSFGLPPTSATAP